MPTQICSWNGNCIDPDPTGAILVSSVSIDLFAQKLRILIADTILVIAKNSSCFVLANINIVGLYRGTLKFC